MKDYFKDDKPKGCYGTALANLFISLGDIDTARKVFETYPKHGLVREDGLSHIGTVTRILRDLTDETYEGILYVNLPEDLDRITEVYFGEMTGKILEATKYEISLGYIQGHNGHIANNGHILYAARGPHDYGHWVVPNIEEDSYIDNGFRKWPIEDLEVMSVLQVRKNNS